MENYKWTNKNSGGKKSTLSKKNKKIKYKIIITINKKSKSYEKFLKKSKKNK